LLYADFNLAVHIDSPCGELPPGLFFKGALMSRDLFFATPMKYSSIAPDGWDERYEHDNYYYDTKSKKIIRQAVRGRDNARDVTANYEKSEEKIIKEKELPADAKSAFDKYLTRKR
jgi:hypothetical protein